MTLAEVEAIRGAGDEQASDGAFSSSSWVYAWREGFKWMTVTILNGEVAAKAQFGLDK